MHINAQDGVFSILREAIHLFKSYSINCQRVIATRCDNGVRRAEPVIEWSDSLSFCCRG